MTVSARDAYAVECDGIRQNFGVVAELTVIMAAKQVVTKYITQPQLLVCEASRGLH